MNGRNHVLVGAVGWLVIAPPVASVLGHPLAPAEVVAGTLLTAGAALLPDTDHPNATVAHTLGPITRALCQLVAAVSGGHRKATHSLLACLGFGALALALTRWTYGVFLMFTLCGAWALRLLGPTHLRRARLALIAVALAAAWAIAHYVPAGPWMAASVALGALLHLVADLITKGGLPLLWPLDRRFSLGLLGTGSQVEHFLSIPLTLGLAWLLAPPVWSLVSAVG